jgi:uncharacterized membrane protein YciS (DUF1049 family)
MIGSVIAEKPFYSENSSSVDFNTIDPEKDFQIPTVVLVGGVIVGYLIGFVFFIPITITILAVSLIKNLNVKQFIARYIALPAQQYNIKELDRVKEEALKTIPHNITVKTEIITTKNNNTLDGISFVPNKFNNVQKKDQKWMVLMFGRLGAYEYNIKKCMDYAEKMGIGIIAVNWKGVGHSQGKTSDAASMQEDGIAIVQYFLNTGILAQNVCIYGHSLGGGVGAAVAKHFQEKDAQQIAFINDRSFGDSRDVVNYLVGRIPGLREGILLLTYFWWNLTPVNDFSFLQGFKWIIYSKEDGVIPYNCASLINQIKLKNPRGRYYNMCLSTPTEKKLGYFGKIRHSLLAHDLPIDAKQLKDLISVWLDNKVEV